jgi:hypothetical protein
VYSGAQGQPDDLRVMSPQGIGISTTYTTRVALEKPCKKR